MIDLALILVGAALAVLAFLLLEGVWDERPGRDEFARVGEHERIADALRDRSTSGGSRTFAEREQ